MEATKMSIDRGVDKDVVHIYNGILLSHKKNEIMPFAAIRMNLEIVKLSEVKQIKVSIIWHCLYAESKKKWYKWTYLKKQKQTHRLREWTCYQGKWWGERIVREFEIHRYPLLYFKWITNKDLLFSTRNSAQCYVAAWMGEELGKNGYMYMYSWVTLLHTWNYHNIVNWLYSNIK